MTRTGPAGIGQCANDARVPTSRPMVTSRPVLGPLDRLECAVCGKWPQFRNWPNHMLAYPSHRAILTEEPPTIIELVASRIREAFPDVPVYIGPPADEALHETHVCRDCGAEITMPYVKVYER